MNILNWFRKPKLISGILPDIRPQEQKQEMAVNISSLRQWLNEDRITDPKKMVTNEQILTWFE